MGTPRTNTAQVVVKDRSVAGPQPDGTPATGSVGGNVPIGGIIMYSGEFAAIPSNWHLCDGTDGTPDLTEKFILGTNTEGDIGTEGGTVQHKHAVGELANSEESAGTPAGSLDSVSAGTPAGSVSLNLTTATDTAVTGAGTRVTNATGSFSGTALAGHSHSFSGSALGTHTHTITGLTDIAQDLDGETGNTLPPYYMLAFIIRLS